MFSTRGTHPQHHKQLMLSARMRKQYDFDSQKKYLQSYNLSSRLRSKAINQPLLCQAPSESDYPMRSPSRDKCPDNLQHYGPKHLFFGLKDPISE